MKQDAKKRRVAAQIECCLNIIDDTLILENQIARRIEERIEERLEQRVARSRGHSIEDDWFERRCDADSDPSYFDEVDSDEDEQLTWAMIRDQNRDPGAELSSTKTVPQSLAILHNQLPKFSPEVPSLYARFGRVSRSPLNYDSLDAPPGVMESDSVPKGSITQGECVTRSGALRTIAGPSSPPSEPCLSISASTLSKRFSIGLFAQFPNIEVFSATLTKRGSAGRDELMHFALLFVERLLAAFPRGGVIVAVDRGESGRWHLHGAVFLPRSWHAMTEEERKLHLKTRAIEVRRHSTLGYLSPDEFENRSAINLAKEVRLSA